MLLDVSPATLMIVAMAVDASLMLLASSAEVLMTGKEVTMSMSHCMYEWYSHPAKSDLSLMRHHLPIIISYLLKQPPNSHLIISCSVLKRESHSIISVLQHVEHEQEDQE